MELFATIAAVIKMFISDIRWSRQNMSKKKCRLQATLVVVLMRVRLLLTALVFEVRKEKRREIIIHCCNQPYKHVKFKISEIEALHRCWITHKQFSTSFFFAQILWSSKVLKTLKALASWQWKKIFFRKLSLSSQSSPLSLPLCPCLSH